MVHPARTAISEPCSVMAQEYAVAAMYTNYREPEEVARQLRRAGLDMKKLAKVGPPTRIGPRPVAAKNAAPNIRPQKPPQKAPRLSPVPLVSWIAAALEGAVVVGGLGVIGARLYSIGIPKDSVVRYETALKSNKFLLVAHGAGDEVTRQ